MFSHRASRCLAESRRAGGRVEAGVERAGAAPGAIVAARVFLLEAELLEEGVFAVGERGVRHVIGLCLDRHVRGLGYVAKRRDRC